MTAHQMIAPYPPQFVIFAKCEEADKLLIVALDIDAFHTSYQARSLGGGLMSLVF